MLFKIDENLPIEAAELLGNAGYPTDTVFDERLAGHPDAEVAARCRAESRILINLDQDFADIRVFPPKHQFGVIVLRPKSL